MCSDTIKAEMLTTSLMDAIIPVKDGFYLQSSSPFTDQVSPTFDQSS